MSIESESNISDLFRSQHGDSYNRFKDEDQVRHAKLLEQIVKPGDLKLNAQRKDNLQWIITVSTTDSVGVLSMISGLFAAHRIDITSGDLFTIHIKSAGESRRSNRFKHLRNSLHHHRRQTVYRKILDVFEVRTEQGVNEEFWKAFGDELTSLIALIAEGKLEQVREDIIFRVTAVFRENLNFDDRLLPISIFMDNESSPNFTGLSIQTLDTTGFIFEFANALAMLNVNIERVEIRSVNSEVQDYFWVSDSHRRKIEESDRLNELRLAATLIKQFTHLLPRAPNPAQALSQFSALTLQMLSNPDWIQEVQALQSSVILRTIAELMGVSQFLWEDFLRMQHENLFPVISDVSGLDRDKTKADLLKEIEESIAIIEEETERINQLNKFKDREMFHIDLRHITQRIDIMAFSDALSDLAEVIVTYASEHAHSTLEKQFGRPLGSNGEVCLWSICALGKFGGRELGFASDIELIFIYEGGGQTDGDHSVKNSYYFEEWVSTFLRTITARQEGIFQIDLRLRPYGKNGSLASTFEGFQKYFSESGDALQFERMALVKLHPVAGDQQLANRILQARDQFVYSGKAIDYNDILHFRHRQASELVPRNAISAKLSNGGLVDVEYFIQALQIKTGMKVPNIRVANIQEAINQLEDSGSISAFQAEELRMTYAFLRRLIDALRSVRGNAKDLTLPASESLEYEYLARRLGYDSGFSLQKEIELRMDFAGKLWDTV